MSNYKTDMVLNFSEHSIYISKNCCSNYTTVIPIYNEVLLLIDPGVGRRRQTRMTNNLDGLA